MTQRDVECTIEELAAWYPRLFVEPYIVACVAILSKYSNSPASLEVDCEGIDGRALGTGGRFRLRVSWKDVTVEKSGRLRATMPSSEVVELASVALAFLLARRLLGLRQLIVTSRGERADYLAPGVSRVLEVSGTESLSEMRRRHRDKVAQAVQNPLGWNAFVIVCGFAATGHRIRVSAHPWRECIRAEDDE
jgi:hypothetical protein